MLNAVTGAFQGADLNFARPLRGAFRAFGQGPAPPRVELSAGVRARVNNAGGREHRRLVRARACGGSGCEVRRCRLSAEAISVERDR
jgi:hypothetical protein